MSKIEEIQEIVSHLPSDQQTLFANIVQAQTKLISGEDDLDKMATKLLALTYTLLCVTGDEEE